MSDPAWAFREVRDPNCRRCPLGALQPPGKTCLPGYGPINSPAVVIGEAPGAREQDLMKPFSGRSGEILDKTLERVGLKREEIFILNVLCCRIIGNEEPTDEMISSCKIFFDKQISMVKPKYALLLGKTALRSLGIKSKEYNVPFKWGDITCIYSVHPAYVLRNPSQYPLFLNGLELLKKLLDKKEEIEPPFVLIKSLREFGEMLKELRGKQFSFDLETKGVDPLPGGILTISFSNGQKSWVLPLEHPESPFTWQRDHIWNILKDLFLSNSVKIAWNSKYDLKWLNSRGISVSNIEDGQLLAYFVNENLPLSLEDQIRLHLSPGFSKEQPKKGEIWDLERLSSYSAKDSYYTFKLWETLDPILRKTPSTYFFYKRVAIPIQTEILPKLELTGIYLDKEKLKYAEEKCKEEIKKIESGLNSYIKKEINWSSPQQVSRVFFEDLKFPIVERTEKGLPSTSERSLLKLYKLTGSEIVRLLLERRKWDKYLTSFIIPYYKLMRDNRIYPSYNFTGTVSGRLSSHDPNIHQVPRENLIRNIFSAPPGKLLLEGDLKQIEFRIASHLSGDPRLIEIFKSGRDPHIETASVFLKKKPEEITKEERKKAKAINFGFLYGMSPQGLVDYFIEKFGKIISFSEAEKWRDVFFSLYPGILEWHKRVSKEVQEKKYISSPLGRIRRLPGILGDEESMSEAIRQAYNAPIQGMSSDLILLTVLEFDRVIGTNHCKLVALVHDCFLYEVEEDKVDIAINNLKFLFWRVWNKILPEEFGVELKVPLEIEMKVGKHWEF